MYIYIYSDLYGKVIFILLKNFLLKQLYKSYSKL